MTKAELSQNVFKDLCEYFDIDGDQCTAMTIRLAFDEVIVVEITRFAGKGDRHISVDGIKKEKVRHTFEVIEE